MDRATNKKTVPLTRMKGKLFLIFHGRFPSEKAASLFAAESCEAFAGQGYEVTLVVPRRFGRIKKTVSDFYGLSNDFKLVFLPIIDLFKIPVLKSLAFYLSFISFSVSTFIYLIFTAKRDDVIYSNESLPLLLALSVFSRTVYEIHDFPRNNLFYRICFRRIASFVVTNRWKKQQLQKIFAISEDKIMAEQNAVSLKDFALHTSKEEARGELGLPKDSPIICYVGMLRTMGMEKGIETAIDALIGLNSAYRLLLVGGSAEDVAYYKKQAVERGIEGRVIFTGFVPHKKVPFYLAASDVLIAPFPKNDHYEFYMSPMKIFEYMASGRPIVSSDLTSIREILDDESAIFVSPGNIDALTCGVEKLLVDKEKAFRFSSKALLMVSDNTWEKRAMRILVFIENALQ